MDTPPKSSNPAAQADPAYLAQRFRALVDSLTDYAVFMIDLAGTITSWNPGVERLLGYGAEEFVGLRFAAIFTPEDAEAGRPAQELERALATGRSDDKRDHLRKNGTRFHADGMVSVIRDDNGVVRAFSKVLHDATAQRRASSALRESEDRYRLLVESVRDYAIFLLDPTGHVESWNPAAERMKGYRSEEIIGQHLRVFFTPEDREAGAPEQELERARLTGRTEAEGWRVRKDGSRFWGDEIVASIRDESGELCGFAKVVRDLTDRQRAALEREQLYARAQEANRLKDEFLGTVSHELRTPLNAILGWSHLLATDDGSVEEERRRRAIATIQRNAELLAQLVDDLLDVSRIISGNMRLEIRPIRMPDVLKAAIEAVQPAAQAKRVALELSIDPACCPIAADPARLQQTVWNLLSNAIKFTASGGRVHLRTRASGDGTDIVVEDTGIGISPEVLPFVFDRFRQADSSTTRRHGGVGLGLAIVRHLVELHGGSVDAASKGTGKGTTITVHLPAAAASTEEPDVVSTPEPPKRLRDDLPRLSNLCVMLVDDDPETREVLHTVLSRAGADVHAADSSAQGLQLLEGRVPDVIIADIGMPEEDGYTFIETARQRLAARGVRPPAIALTAYARAEDRERALAAGFDRHISKPFDPRAVLMAVTELVGASP